jgi:hypothetical protein
LRTRGSFGTSGNGVCFRSSGRSFFSSRSISSSSKPVPTLPTYSSPFSPCTASTSEPNDHSRRPLPAGIARDHELLLEVRLELQPVA